MLPDFIKAIIWFFAALGGGFSIFIMLYSFFKIVKDESTGERYR